MSNKSKTLVCIVLYFVFFILIGLILKPISVRIVVVEKKPKTEKQLRHQEITISYNACLETVYTGAITYLPYKGSKKFTVNRKAFSLYGLNSLYELIFDIQRENGEKGKLYVSPRMKRGENTFVRFNDRIFIMSAYILKKDDDHFEFFIANNPKEAEKIAKASI